MRDTTHYPQTFIVLMNQTMEIQTLDNQISSILSTGDMSLMPQWISEFSIPSIKGLTGLNADGTHKMIAFLTT